jgi:epoxyqueuosine reductase
MIDFIRKFISERGGITGFCSAEPLDRTRYGGFTPFVNADLEKRINPDAVLPGAQSVIVVGFVHEVPDCRSNGPVLSSLGISGDYHKKIKSALRELVSALQDRIAFKHKILVDSGTLDERALAVRAGLGFLGRNGLVISKKFGSFFNIGCLLTDIPVEALIGAVDDIDAVTLIEGEDSYVSTLQSAANVSDKCFSCPPGCRLCADACPGGALSPDGRFDAANCVSYITQKDGELTPNEARLMGNQLYGCDMCRDVCPFNAHIKRTPAPEISPGEWLALTDAELAGRIAGTAMEWKGAGILKRNAHAVLNKLRVGKEGAADGYKQPRSAYFERK